MIQRKTLGIAAFSQFSQETWPFFSFLQIYWQYMGTRIRWHNCSLKEIESLQFFFLKDN